jgi:hypothetical protein
MDIIKDTNDILALFLLILIIPGLWIVDGTGVLNLNAQVVGATIMGWGLILQYYFRKKLSEKGG